MPTNLISPNTIVMGFDEVAGNYSAFDDTIGDSAHVDVTNRTRDSFANSTIYEEHIEHWTENYSELQDIAFSSGDGRVAELQFDVAAGYQVTFDSFDFGNYVDGQSAKDATFRIYDSAWNVVWESQVTGHTGLSENIAPDITLTGTSYFQWGTDWDIGIDNFSYTSSVATPIDITVPTADEIFASEGKLAFLAKMSLGAYQLATHEATGDTYNYDTTAAQSLAYRETSDALYLFGTDDLPSLTQGVLDTKPNYPWTDMLGNVGADTGLYSRKNASALIGRSEDAIFVAFRGTNSDPGLKFNSDHADWGVRKAHFSKFLPMLKAIKTYVAEQNAVGAEIDKIFLTGHSLGAGMVQPTYEWFQKKLPNVAVEGVTFASPGYSLDLLDIDDDPDVNITNFWNAFDIIKLAANQSEVLGAQYNFNNVLENLLDGVGPLTAHSMELYHDIAQSLLEEGRKDAGAGIDVDTLLTENIDRIAVSIQPQSDGSFEIGNERDFLLAGVFEFSVAALKLLTTPITLGISALKAILTAIATVIDVIAAPIADPNVESVFDFAKSLFGEVIDTLGSVLQIIYSASGLEFLVDTVSELATSLFHADLLVGGDKPDLLFGLGGKDVLFGGTGHDALFGGWGQDTLFGGIGNDSLNGGLGKDEMSGGAGNDLYFVNKSNDVVIEQSGKGTDTVVSSASYVLFENVERLVLDGGLLSGSLLDGVSGTGNSMGNVITGDKWGNVLKGLAGQDFLSGEGGGDTLYGGSHDDVLFGGKGGDNLFGGTEDDILDGGAGKDSYTGGSGADVFVFSSAKDVKSDVIEDFQPDADTIDLSRLGIEMSTTLQFSGTNFTGAAGDVRYQKVNKLFGDDFTWVKIDFDGDEKQDLRIKVMDLHDLTASDFIL